MIDISLKANGLHSGTKFYEYRMGDVNVEYHEHPKTGELVIMHTWRVQDGDCTSGEFEVVGVYPYVGCLLAKMNAPYMIDGKMPLLSKN